MTRVMSAENSFPPPPPSPLAAFSIPSSSSNLSKSALHMVFLHNMERHSESELKEIPFLKEIHSVPVAYRKMIYAKKDPIGKGWTLHTTANDVQKKLKPNDILDFAYEFYKLGLSEDEKGHSYFVCAIVHNGTAAGPSLIHYLNTEPILEVKAENMAEQQMTMNQYKAKVNENYKGWSNCHGSLKPFVRIGNEYAPYFKGLHWTLGQNPFIRPILPSWACVRWTPKIGLGNGHVMWIKPGEHLNPITGVSKRCSTSAVVLYHEMASNFSEFNSNPPAIGLVKRIEILNDPSDPNQVASNVIVFSAKDHDSLATKILLAELSATYKTQASDWIDETDLNLMNGVVYSKFDLSDNSLYTFPRNNLHQVKTLTSTGCIAWHWGQEGERTTTRKSQQRKKEACFKVPIHVKKSYYNNDVYIPVISIEFGWSKCFSVKKLSSPKKENGVGNETCSTKSIEDNHGPSSSKKGRKNASITQGNDKLKDTNKSSKAEFVPQEKSIPTRKPRKKKIKVVEPITIALTSTTASIVEKVVKKRGRKKKIDIQNNLDSATESIAALAIAPLPGKAPTGGTQPKQEMDPNAKKIRKRRSKKRFPIDTAADEGNPLDIF